MPPAKLSDSERVSLLQPLLNNGWTMVDGRDAIHKKFQFTDFKQAFGVMTMIALKAEQVNHHPEWFNVYNRLEITWSTHDCNGLSLNDIQMASFCDEVAK